MYDSNTSTARMRGRYKKACGRLKLLRKIMPFLNITAARLSLVIPIITYTVVYWIWIWETIKGTFLSFHDRAMDIITSNTDHELNIKTSLSTNKIKACQLVRKCIDEMFVQILRITSWNVLITWRHEITDINLSYRKSNKYSGGSFCYMGTKLLPLQIRKTDDHDSFNNLLSDHF